MHKKDFIIVGCGIAGAALYEHLTALNKDVLIIDENAKITSSRVSGGVCNPIVFKRITFSWRVQELLPYALSFFKKQEEKYNASFVMENIPIYKIFGSQEEKAYWDKKSITLKDWISPSTQINQVPNHFGSGLVKQVLRVDVNNWLDAIINHLKKNNNILFDSFDYDLLEIKDDIVKYKNFEAKGLIFCEGYKSIHNPFFNWLPFKFTKGEVLTVEDEINTQGIIHKGGFVATVGPQQQKVGATYNWDDLTEQTTEEAKNILLKKYEHITGRSPKKIIQQEVGIRPTVKDRRPLLGNHPDFKNLYVFNGLGTKGAMLGPYFANEMAQFLLNNRPIDKTVNCQRYL